MRLRQRRVCKQQYTVSVSNRYRVEKKKKMFFSPRATNNGIVRHASVTQRRNIQWRGYSGHKTLALFPSKTLQNRVFLV